MLSDAIAELRDRLLPVVSQTEVTGIFLTLRAFEMEARNMEERIHYLTGNPHVPLYGRLMSSAAIGEMGARS